MHYTQQGLTILWQTNKVRYVYFSKKNVFVLSWAAHSMNAEPSQSLAVVDHRSADLKINQY